MYKNVNRTINIHMYVLHVRYVKDFSPSDISFSSCTCVPLVSKETAIPIPLIVLMSVTYKQRGVHVINYIKIVSTADF
jgi:hypothetical protein